MKATHLSLFEELGSAIYLRKRQVLLVSKLKSDLCRTLSACSNFTHLRSPSIFLEASWLQEKKKEKRKA